MYDPKSSEQEALWEECTIQAMDLYVACEQLFARCTGADDRTWSEPPSPEKQWEAERGGRSKEFFERYLPQRYLGRRGRFWHFFWTALSQCD